MAFSEDLETEDIDPLRNKLIKVKKIRKDIEEYNDLTEIEMVQLWNLCPTSIDEAISWISTLERFQEQGKEIYLKQVLEVIQNSTPVDPNTLN